MNDEKPDKTLISARIDAEIREAMQAWADKNKLPISWVIGRVIDLGWPLFVEQPLPTEEERKTA